jgi:hypothetical protein
VIAVVARDFSDAQALFPEISNFNTLLSSKPLIFLEVHVRPTLFQQLVRIERYFRLNEVRVHEKLDAAVIALEDKALNWFVWWEEQTASRTWDEFKLSLIRRFQPGILQNPLGPLLNLKQRGSVMEYREKFEMLVAPI